MLLGAEGRVPIQKKACDDCQSLENPRTVNKVTLGTAIGTLMQLGEFEQKTHGHLMDALHGEMGAIYDTGPGTNLKRYLSWFASETPDCPCQDRAKVMNAWGPDLCKKNMDIILGWLQESASKKGIPFVRFIAKIIVSRAISEGRNG
jgi:hypothetical protein